MRIFKRGSMGFPERSIETNEVDTTPCPNCYGRGWVWNASDPDCVGDRCANGCRSSVQHIKDFVARGHQK